MQDNICMYVPYQENGRCVFGS